MRPSHHHHTHIHDDILGQKSRAPCHPLPSAGPLLCEVFITSASNMGPRDRDAAVTFHRLTVTVGVGLIKYSWKV